MTYFLGGTEVQFRFAGPAHTWGDVMAYLPQHKILFAGDVAFFWVAPYANNSYITKWLETCDKIAGWDVDVIVPGHGRSAARRNSPRWRAISACSASRRASATTRR